MRSPERGPLDLVDQHNFNGVVEVEGKLQWAGS